MHRFYGITALSWMDDDIDDYTLTYRVEISPKIQVVCTCRLFTVVINGIIKRILCHKKAFHYLRIFFLNFPWTPCICCYYIMNKYPSYLCEYKGIHQGLAMNIYDRRPVTVATKYPWPKLENHRHDISHGYETSVKDIRNQ